MLYKIVAAAPMRLHVGNKLSHDVELVEAREDEFLVLRRRFVVDELLENVQELKDVYAEALEFIEKVRAGK